MDAAPHQRKGDLLAHTHRCDEAEDFIAGDAHANARGGGDTGASLQRGAEGGEGVRHYQLSFVLLVRFATVHGVEGLVNRI